MRDRMRNEGDYDNVVEQLELARADLKAVHFRLNGLVVPDGYGQLALDRLLRRVQEVRLMLDNLYYWARTMREQLDRSGQMQRTGTADRNVADEEEE